ncbi:TPA: hypothetical protein ON424_001605, partial [Morganella morganii]|nr:hypothetical protein [Morganella morganii]
MAVNDEGDVSNNKIKKATLWNWVQAICTVLFILFVLLKFYNSTFQVDFSTLLSIILAIFSIWLSATFYFKATETSNLFYQNTYVHSKDIATLLAKIESGFGEKLNSLNSNYLNMRDIIQIPVEKREEIKNEVTKGNDEIEEIKTSLSEIIDSLFEKTDLGEQEQNKIREELKNKEDKLKAAEKNVLDLENKLSDLNIENSNYVNIKGDGSPEINYFVNRIHEGVNIDALSIRSINERISELLEIDIIFRSLRVRFIE